MGGGRWVVCRLVDNTMMMVVEQVLPAPLGLSSLIGADGDPSWVVDGYRCMSEVLRQIFHMVCEWRRE